jgi:Tol biopolymer transport system component
MTDQTDVRRFLQSMADEARFHPVDAHSVVRRARRRLAVTLSGTLLAVGALVAGSVMGANWLTSAPAPKPANEPPAVTPGTMSGPFFLELQTGERTPLTHGPDGVFSYVASPDGTRLVYNTCCDGNDVMRIANIDGTDARTLRPPKGLDYYGARWSPDGTKLVYQERNGVVSGSVGNLFVHDLSSGRRTQLTDLKLSNASWWFLSPSFSPDGRDVIFHQPRSSSLTTKFDVWSVPVTGGEPTLVLRNATFPLYFPDGREIAFVEPFTSNFAGHRISIVSPDGKGSRRTLVEPKNISIGYPTMSPNGSRIAYQDGGAIYVVDVSTGESSKVADAEIAEWLDDDTLIVIP